MSPVGGRGDGPGPLSLGLYPKGWEWGGLSGWEIHQNSSQCFVPKQCDLSSAGAISKSFWDPFRFSSSFRYGREKLPEIGFSQEIFLGVRRAVERTVSEAEETQCFLDAPASAPVPAVGPGRGDAALGPLPGLRHTQMLSPGLNLQFRPLSRQERNWCPVRVSELLRATQGGNGRVRQGRQT